MTHTDLNSYLLSFENTWIDYPFGEAMAVYKAGEKNSSEAKMFALMDKSVTPLRVSLKCDPLLAETLRERYETVVAGENLSKKHWNTIICTGQLDDEEIKDLARLSYRLATE